MSTTLRLVVTLVIGLTAVACDSPKASPQPISSASSASSLPRPQDSSPSGRLGCAVGKDSARRGGCPKEKRPGNLPERWIHRVRRPHDGGRCAPSAPEAFRRHRTRRAEEGQDARPLASAQERRPRSVPFSLLHRAQRPLFGAGELDDISLLKSATSLESLRVSATRVTDLSPLSGLTKLDRLDLGRTPVRDVPSSFDSGQPHRARARRHRGERCGSARAARQARKAAHQAHQGQRRRPASRH